LYLVKEVFLELFDGRSGFHGGVGDLRRMSVLASGGGGCLRIVSEKLHGEVWCLRLCRRAMEMYGNDGY
jgi:hypothetical protein